MAVAIMNRITIMASLIEMLIVHPRFGTLGGDDQWDRLADAFRAIA
ncbi:MAG: hypothetical protein OXB95_04025 [Rhodobacteraceae bacterium]|nr:hypothetical protein [Paracoccaceae bacterium]